MNRRPRYAMCLVLRRVPLSHRRQVESVLWDAWTAYRNLVFRLTHPRLMLRVARLVRLRARGLTELEA